MNVYDDQHHDQKLVENALAGHQPSFDKLIRKYYTAAWAQAYQWTKYTTDTQDILQTAFLQAYQNLAQLKNPDKFSGWLRGIIINTRKMWQRSQKLHIEVNEDKKTIPISTQGDSQAFLEAEESYEH
jgi:RNA polymerase sigma factor (sigma-70 family)